MPKTVTYNGKADQYRVRDSGGKNHYFPKGQAVEVSDEVAALVPKDDKFTVADVKGGGSDAAASPRSRTSSTTSTGSSEENK